uniref:Capsid protein n=1 Tax=Phoenicopteridae parvo-like hybrid virus TaxID=2794528 RepID=A0A8A4XD73_9VIRU|nr:MAG: capsid protein [Phoenicopteridae parvo-like hybrid virus]
MPSKAKKRRWFSRGLTLPGYNYLGPFNSEDNGEPTNASDRAARKHDAMYKQLSNKHGFLAPYFKFSKADEDFIKETGDDYGGRWGKRFFEFKKRFASSFAPERPQVVSGGNVLGKRRREDDPLPFQKIMRSEGGSSLLNLQDNTQQDANMDGDSSAVGSGNNLGLKETPIDPVPQDVTRGPPDYTYASLPYYRDTKTSLVAAWAYDYGFRMTSPLDPAMTQAAAVDLNAGAGSAATVTVEALDSSDVAQTSARWFDFYSTLYNYYHVVGAKWHFMCENLSQEPMWCHVLHCNDEIPPITATNEDIQCWNDTESHFIGCHSYGVVTGGINRNESNANENNVEGSNTAGTTSNFSSGNNIASRASSPVIKLSGSYRPGDSKRQIHLDSEIENWTSVAANPSLPERLLFRFKPYWNALDTNNATSYNRSMLFRWTFKIDYLVEFKELKSGLRWPIERQPVICAIQTNAEEDEE